MLTAPERLSPASRELLEDGASELLLSVASAWEIAIKHSLGKLPLPESPASLIPEMLRGARTSTLPIALHHALRVAALPFHHRDPFDRLIVAQAQVESVPILSADRQLAAYDVEILPA